MAYRAAKLANWLFTQGAETEKRQTMAEIGTPDSLSTRQRRFIAALLETATIRDAAKAAAMPAGPPPHTATSQRAIRSDRAFMSSFMLLCRNP